MKPNIYIILVALLFFYSCKKENVTDCSLINTSHLEHLYQDVILSNNTQIGTVWIYCNAPDYRRVTDEDEGFSCVDDVARTLIFYCRKYRIKPIEQDIEKIKHLTNFIFYMKADNGYYYNFLFPDDEINKSHINSQANPNFWTWRAFWALSELCLINSVELHDIQEEAKTQLYSLTQKIDILFQSPYEIIEIEGLTMPKWMEDYGSDQISVIMLGLTNYYKINPDGNIKNLIVRLGEAIISVQYGNKDKFPYGAFLSWKNVWHAWGSVQSYALLKAGNELDIESFVTAALKEVDNFYSYRHEQSYFHEFYIKKADDSIQTYGLKKFPQIAYNISPMILASVEAYHITKSEKYAVLAGQLGSWFFGKNAANQKMYDINTGRVFDGIDSENNVNYNSGAESTIETLLSLQAIETFPKTVQTLKANM